MQKIIPHLWFDKEAKEAAEFYTSLFSVGGGQADSKITNATTLHDTPSGDCDIVSFELWGYSFMAISAGPLFKFNPSISFMVNFDPSQDINAKTRIDTIWAKLSERGKVLMPIDKYPFSERYGWVQDKYGLSWQLILTNPEGEERPLIIPSLLFVGDVCGKAEEASDFYLSVFKDSKRGAIARYPAGMEPDKEGTVMFTDFMLEGQWVAAMDSARMHDFNFNEAISLIVNCEDQKEIDYYWKKLSAVPEAEQCGWLKDKYGVSWQIVPKEMEKMMSKGTREQIDRVTQSFLPMKKFDIAKLKQAYEGK
ncbi:MAG: VOC family protein [Nitrospirae bacterium]|nr:VOC family protein [Nitrospirota bacterium]